MSETFHDEPFDEGTKTKLELFQCYAEAWLPVFVAAHTIRWPQVHIYDFFAGSGTDSDGVEGSPLRLLRAINKFRRYLETPSIKLTLHLFDANKGKIEKLKTVIEERGYDDLPIDFDVLDGDFSERFESAKGSIAANDTANLLIIDQFGIKEVPDGVFEQIVAFPRTDVLFFISSNTFRRFEHVPEVKRLLLPGYQRPEDYYHAHFAVADAYRQLLPKGKRYHLASFSIKKNSNVYGVIFGSGHPLGMDKFLEVAWDKDKISGDANFDIHREGIRPDAPALFERFDVPNKVKMFEEDLEKQILAGKCPDESAIITICHRHGVRRKHAEPVLMRLKKEKHIECAFRVPDIDRLLSPRLLKLLY